MGFKARFFGRLRDNNNYISLFECSCGNREWIKETEENPKEISCSSCAEEYLVMRHGNGHYIIVEDE